MMKVVEEYIRADYVVQYEEYAVAVEEIRCNVRCVPPLFAGL